MYCKICGKWQTTIVSARKHVIEYHPEQNHFMDCYGDDFFSKEYYELIQESKRRGYRAIARRSPIEFQWLGNLWWYHSDIGVRLQKREYKRKEKNLFFYL